VHPTGGNAPPKWVYTWLEAGSVKVVWSRPTHQRVTQAVGREINWNRKGENQVSDWRELDELIRKRQESEKQRISLQNEKEEQEKQRQIAFQKDVLAAQPRFVELLSYWDKVVTKYLTRIGKETWNGWQGSISKSLDYGEPTDGNINLRVADQLHGDTSIIRWSVESNNYFFGVNLHIKDFRPVRIVVTGKNEHIAKATNEDELKKALLIAFQEGPEYISSQSDRLEFN